MKINYQNIAQIAHEIRRKYSPVLLAYKSFSSIVKHWVSEDSHHGSMALSLLNVIEQHLHEMIFDEIELAEQDYAKHIIKTEGLQSAEKKQED